jgi:5-hydroxyisourate hydrolase
MPTISTHVLDTSRGVPARGVRVELFRGSTMVSAQDTNDDGRIADLVGGTFVAGAYRLVFHVPSPFFKKMEVEFVIDDTSRHYHIPLLVAPYSCATYRGT